MTPPTHTSPIPLLRTLGFALLATWGVATTLAVLGGWAISPDVAAAGVLGSGIVLVGTVAGLAALGFGLGVRAVEPGFVVLGASIFRAIAALFSGLIVQRVSVAPDRPFWLSFLIVIAAVMAVEVIVARRQLDAPTTEPHAP